MFFRPSNISLTSNSLFSEIDKKPKIISSPLAVQKISRIRKIKPPENVPNAPLNIIAESATDADEEELPISNKRIIVQKTGGGFIPPDPTYSENYLDRPELYDNVEYIYEPEDEGERSETGDNYPVIHYTDRDGTIDFLNRPLAMKYGTVLFDVYRVRQGKVRCKYRFPG